MPQPSGSRSEVDQSSAPGATNALRIVELDTDADGTESGWAVDLQRSDYASEVTHIANARSGRLVIALQGPAGCSLVVVGSDRSQEVVKQLDNRTVTYFEAGLLITKRQDNGEHEAFVYDCE